MTLWRVRATVADRPGFLAVLAASLALRSVNILSVGVHITEHGAVDDFLVDAPDDLTEPQLLAAVERGRGRDAWVARAQAHSLVDGPTRALDLATYLLREPGTPGTTGHALGELLDGQARWQPDAGPLGVTGSRMWVPAPGGGAWLVERDAPPFTPAEYARAQALLAVAAQRAADRGGGYASLLLPDGRELLVRPAGAGDLAAVRHLHDRCSPASRQHRYLGTAGTPSDAQLARLLVPARGGTLLVEAADAGPAGAGPTGAGPTAGAGPVVAMANLLGEGVQVELAVLVADAWQRRGIGAALLRRALAFASGIGFDAAVVHAYAHNEAVRRTLRRLDGAGHTDRDGHLLTTTFPLRRPALATPA